MSRSVGLVAAALLFVLTGGCSESAAVRSPEPIDDGESLAIDPELIEAAIAFQEIAIAAHQRKIEELNEIKESVVFGKVPSKFESLHLDLQRDAARKQRSIDDQIKHEIAENESAMKSIARGDSYELPNLQLDSSAPSTLRQLALGDWGEFCTWIRVMRKISGTEFFGIAQFAVWRQDDGCPYYFDGWNAENIAHGDSERGFLKCDGAQVVGFKVRAIDGQEVKMPILKRFNRDKFGREVMRQKKKNGQ